MDEEMPPFGVRVSVRPVIKAADGIATTIVYVASFHAGPTTTLDSPKPFSTRTDDASFDFRGDGDAGSLRDRRARLRATTMTTTTTSKTPAQPATMYVVMGLTLGSVTV